MPLFLSDSDDSDNIGFIRQHEPNRFVPIDQVPDNEEDLLERIDESNREIQLGVIMPELGSHVVKETLIRNRNERIVAVCCNGNNGLTKITERQLGTIIDPRPLFAPQSLVIAEVMEQKLGNVCVISPKKFFNQGKRRWKR